MSFTSEKRNQIKHYFLEKIKEEPNNAVKKHVKHLIYLKIQFIAILEN